jgi:MYXO-CTERM domain-containing protein
VTDAATARLAKSDGEVLEELDAETTAQALSNADASGSGGCDCHVAGAPGSTDFGMFNWLFAVLLVALSVRRRLGR